MKKYIILLAVTLFSTSNISATVPEQNPQQDATRVNRMSQSNGWFFSGGYMSLDSDNADVELIDSDAFSINLGWEGHDETLVYAVGISGLFLSDNDSFSQVVEGNIGGTFTASSSAEAFGVFGEIGYSYDLPSTNTAFEILAGFEFLSAERSIPNCSNCYSEDINLDSGLYIKPRYRFYNDNGFIFSLAYQHYLTGDVNGGVSLMFSWHK